MSYFSSMGRKIGVRMRVALTQSMNTPTIKSQSGMIIKKTLGEVMESTMA
jgi:hypothetical protein